MRVRWAGCPALRQLEACRYGGVARAVWREIAHVTGSGRAVLLCLSFAGRVARRDGRVARAYLVFGWVVLWCV